MQTEQNEYQECERISVPYFKGYRCLGWKVPKKGEYCLSSLSDSFHALVACVESDWGLTHVVYEKLPPKRYVLEEIPGKQLLNNGDIYIDEQGRIQTWSWETSLAEYTVLKIVNE